MDTEGDFLGEKVGRSSIPPDLYPGMRVGTRYELTRKLGTGAMGEVWAAQHVSLQEEVAIKIVLRDVAHDDGSSADSRFLLEARVASQLSRKTRHIVQVTDHGEDGRYAYLVMELLEGESLDARLARTGPMPLAKVVPLVYQVARALAVAHADGIVHRDLKPSNVFVTADEDGKALIKILDFGIAKLRASFGRVSLTSEAKQSTMRGFLLGTPAFMSPEQARGRKVDHRADVWALAVIAYHLLTAQFPFDGETPEEIFAQLSRVEPTPISKYRPDLPPIIGDLFDRAFAERLDERFQSAVAFAGALEQAETVQSRLSGTPPQPMNAISLPPSIKIEIHPRVPAPPPPPRLPSLPEIESSMVAAGVPRRLWPRLVAIGVVAGILIATVSVISIYFERDPRKPNALPIGASVGEIRPPERESIPSPEPVTDTEPEPMPSDSAVPPPHPTAVPAVAAPQASVAPPTSLAAPPPSASQAPPPERRGDRSEVF